MSKEQVLYDLWRAKLKTNSTYTSELDSIATNKDEILDRFYMDLQFGTAGLRGVLGLGTNRMNVFTVGRATQGLANYLNEISDCPSVSVAYDSRNFSKEFAHYASTVFAANGVKVHLFAELVPTPTLSFAIREFGCDSGINITASHNPAIYNGYKAYGNDGCQLSTEGSDRVMTFVNSLDIFEDVKTVDFDLALEKGLINFIPDSFIEKYIDRVYQEALEPELCKKANLNVVYTPLNGAGNRFVRAILDKLGIKNIYIVKEQEHPDGNFPTCPYPNPEMKEALTLGLDLLKEKNADILIATDPDSDRLGVAVAHKGEFKILTGNEIGVLLLDYIIKARKKLNIMPAKPFAIRSIVTTKLTDAITNAAGVELIPTLTGFKFIGGVIRDKEAAGEAENFIFGYEESCGYLSGTYVRDKDAVDAALLTAEMASAYKLEGKTLVDVMDEMTAEFGLYHTYTQNIGFAGADGMEKMANIMDTLRSNPPTEVAERKVLAYIDYESSTRYENGVESKITIPSSNVLEYELDDSCSVVIRPSGTEPKIKLYYFIQGASDEQVLDMEKMYVAAFNELIGL